MIFPTLRRPQRLKFCCDCWLNLVRCHLMSKFYLQLRILLGAFIFIVLISQASAQDTRSNFPLPTKTRLLGGLGVCLGGIDDIWTDICAKIPGPGLKETDARILEFGNRYRPMIQLLKSAGFRWVRTDIHWTNLQNQRGWSFQPWRFVRLAQVIRSEGLRPIFILRAARMPVDPVNDAGRELINTDSERDEFANVFLAYLLAAMKKTPLYPVDTTPAPPAGFPVTWTMPTSVANAAVPTGIVWEFWNEPDDYKRWFNYDYSLPGRGGDAQKNDDVLALLKRTTDFLWNKSNTLVTHPTDTDPWIIAPAYADTQHYTSAINFLNRAIDGNSTPDSSYSILMNCDGISVHPYNCVDWGASLPTLLPPEQQFPYGQSPNNLTMLQSKIASGRSALNLVREVPIVSSESGYLSKFDPGLPLNEALAASYSIRQYFYHLYCGVPFSVYYCAFYPGNWTWSDTAPPVPSLQTADYHQYFGISVPNMAVTDPYFHPESYVLNGIGKAFQKLAEVFPSSENWQYSAAGSFTTSNSFLLKFTYASKVAYVGWRINATATSKTLTSALTFRKFYLDGRATPEGSPVTPVSGQVTFALEEVPIVFIQQ